MKVAIQGELGSFSHQAALRMVPGCTIVPCARSADVFARVAVGMLAVIPLENTLAGSVAEHFDLLLTERAFIRKEFRLRIVHNLSLDELPQNVDDLEKLARRLGCETDQAGSAGKEFLADLERHTTHVREVFLRLSAAERGHGHIAHAVPAT